MENVLILGSGLSGIGACHLAMKKKMNIRISDINNITPETKNLLFKFNISWEEGGHSLSNLDWAKSIVKSPGISNEIDCIIDDKKLKHGKFLPGMKIPIKSNIIKTCL